MINNWLIVLISGIFLGAISGYLGSLMLSRRMTVVVDPLSHLALPGMAIALIFGKDVSFGAFLFLFFGTFLIWFLEQKTKLATETIIAILFSFSLALTFLFLNEEQLHNILVGDISNIGKLEGLIVILLCFFVFLLIRRMYQKILLISFSEDLAQAEGINIKKYQLLYLISISIIVALGVKFVGGLLVAGLTVLPAASARNLAKNLRIYKFLSAFLGLLSVILGFLFSEIIKIPFAPFIVIFSFLIFLLSLIFKKY